MLNSVKIQLLLDIHYFQNQLTNFMKIHMTFYDHYQKLLLTVMDLKSSRFIVLTNQISKFWLSSIGERNFIGKYKKYKNKHWFFLFLRNYKYSGAYIRRKIDELDTRWYSSRCYLRYYDEKNDGRRTLGLTVLETVEKNEMVALFSNSNLISETSHHLRDSKQPTCYVLSSGEVYAARDLDASSELTLDYRLTKAD
jgi:hypothetical protein